MQDLKDRPIHVKHHIYVILMIAKYAGSMDGS